MLPRHDLSNPPPGIHSQLLELIKLGRKYKVIYPDPPWKYGNFDTSKNFKYGGLASTHYNTMTFEQLAELPVKEIAEDDAFMFLWTTWPILMVNSAELHHMINSWGFEAKTCGFLWVKTNKNDNKPFFGMGTYTAANSEPCILCTRGKVKKLVKSNKVSQIVMAPIAKHSQKPDKVRNNIVKLCGDVPRIELFARTKPHGWDALGNDHKLQLQPLEAFG